MIIVAFIVVIIVAFIVVIIVVIIIVFIVAFIVVFIIVFIVTISLSWLHSMELTAILHTTIDTPQVSPQQTSKGFLSGRMLYAEQTNARLRD